MSLKTVKVPKEMEPVFERAERVVSEYFSKRKDDPSQGTIEIFGERYVLIRSAALSVDFFKLVEQLFGKGKKGEAHEFARNILFDLAHSIGKSDAKNFHKKMNLKEPSTKLSAGPVHFSHSGWAYVDIFPESSPSPDENYYLIYDHPYSFESDAWKRSGEKSDFPVCVMNAGYSSGWCEESFGIKLVASEILCQAKGDDCCRFIMAPPNRIEEHIERYLKEKPQLKPRIKGYEIPDFFARKKMEDELRDREHILKTIFESVGNGLLVVNEKGMVTHKNTQFAQMWSIPKDITDRSNDKELLDYVLTQLVEPEEFLSKVQKLYKSDEQSLDMIRFIDGRTFERFSSPLIREGKVTGRVWSFRDITERKQAEEKIIKLSTAVQQSPSIVAITDLKGNLEYVNPKFTELTGYTSEEAIGQNPRILKSGELSDETYKELWDTISSGKEWRGEFHNKKNSGELYWEAASISPIIDKQGKMINYIKVAEDITERKAADDKLKQEKKHLEKLNEIMFGRERRVLEVKNEVNDLLRELGKEPKYGER